MIGIIVSSTLANMEPLSTCPYEPVNAELISIGNVWYPFVMSRTR